ncbi:carboxymuconolactone decarboxylase family protein [Solihabitans fulvus]|uniref:Carboxymuconolactone decarboxylase family protein n=1 Tax=Solihabitans fulvus TaxID=1892852 RepID=A0A5B2WP35_9PSEU|nr:carboxymuconolactone decarboxylase family protein [Solihabitans fulvus]KAA2252580.1 carboxymuconolactone decarboxylase family protein [Solihabitans fulvus]
MGRVPPVRDGEDVEFDAYTEQLRASGAEVPNLTRVMGRNLHILSRWAAYNNALRFTSSLSEQTAELVILAVAAETDCRYSFAHHVHKALQCGIEPAKLAELRDWERSSRFDERELLVLRAVREITRRLRVGDETFALLRRRFHAEEVVDLVQLAAFYVSLSITTRSLDVDLEPSHRSWADSYWPDVS